MEVGVTEGHEFYFSAMFDRVNHPAQGRVGGASGAPTTIEQDDGSTMQGKGKQFVPHGRRVMLGFPGGAGYGSPAQRDPERLREDLLGEYITADAAKRDYGMSDKQIAAILANQAQTSERED